MRTSVRDSGRQTIEIGFAVNVFRIDPVCLSSIASSRKAQYRSGIFASAVKRRGTGSEIVECLIDCLEVQTAVGHPLSRPGNWILVVAAVIII